MNKKINLSLLSIGVISAAAFVGFGSIFHELGISIGTQAVTAAFGALFVLLSTKFLMEQESETRVQGEKTSKIFEEQLREYKNVSDCMQKILQNDRISLQDAHNLLDKHAILILIGEQKAIEQSSFFIEKCHDIFSKSSGQEIDGKYPIDEEAHKELNTILIGFLTAARADLSLKSDFDPQVQKNLFEKVSDKQTTLEIGVRSKVSLSDWKSVKDKPSSISNVETFIKILEKRRLKSKITKNEISFRCSTLAGGNIIYLKNFTMDKTFILHFSPKPDKGFLESQKSKVAEFEPTIVIYKDKYSLRLKIPMNSVADEKLGGFFRVIDAFLADRRH